MNVIEIKDLHLSKDQQLLLRHIKMFKNRVWFYKHIYKLSDKNVSLKDFLGLLVCECSKCFNIHLVKAVREFFLTCFHKHYFFNVLCLKHLINSVTVSMAYMYITGPTLEIHWSQIYYKKCYRWNSRQIVTNIYWRTFVSLFYIAKTF